MDVVDEALCVLLWHQHQTVNMLLHFPGERFDEYARYCDGLGQYYRYLRDDLVNAAGKRGFRLKSRPMSSNGMINLLNGMSVRLDAGREISLAMKPLGSPFTEQAAQQLAGATQVVKDQLCRAISEYGSSIVPSALTPLAAGLKQQPENEDG